MDYVARNRINEAASRSGGSRTGARSGLECMVESYPKQISECFLTKIFGFSFRQIAQSPREAGEQVVSIFCGAVDAI